MTTAEVQKAFDVTAENQKESFKIVELVNSRLFEVFKSIAELLPPVEPVADVIPP